MKMTANKKILATHPSPHIDDICGIWLLKRFHPLYKNALCRFIEQGKNVDNKKATAIGIGRGKYDEHKGDLNESAATLVFRDVKKYIKKSVDILALCELVNWIRDEDHAKFIANPEHEFAVAVSVMAIPKLRGKNSRDALVWGMLGLDAIFETLKEKHQLDLDWKARKVFNSKFGPSVALITSASSVNVARKSMREGFMLFVVVNPSAKYRYIKSASGMANVDLTSAYAQVKEIEPLSEWYLHHSKRMLICGSDVAQNKHLSKLSLDDLIKLIE